MDDFIDVYDFLMIFVIIFDNFLYFIMLIFWAWFPSFTRVSIVFQLLSAVDLFSFLLLSVLAVTTALPQLIQNGHQILSPGLRRVG